jgi:hypothetical protein
MHIRPLSVMLAVSLGSLPMAVSASAQRTFVATTGSDANSCALTAPCRSFGAAITKTNANGEVVVLDSGGYGPVTISQSISLIAPPGVYAGVTVFGGDGVTIDAIGATVVLRGLSINGQGGAIGVNVVQVDRLRIEGCVISNMSSNGVVIFASGSETVIADTIVRDNGGTGVGVATDAAVLLDHVRSEHNQSDGFYITPVGGNATATITDSVMSFNGNNGVWAHSLGDATSNLAVVVARSALANNSGNGFRTDTAAGHVTATARGNVFQRNIIDGLRVFSTSTVPNSNDTVLASIGDNTFQANGNSAIRCGSSGNQPTITVDRNAIVFNETHDFENTGGCFFESLATNYGTKNNTGTISSDSGF